MADTRTLTTCDQCGKADDHPKVHIAGPENADTFHHDCLSVRNEKLVTESSPEAKAVIAKAKAGVRGADLLTFIESQKKGK